MLSFNKIKLNLIIEKIKAYVIKLKLLFCNEENEGEIDYSFQRKCVADLIFKVLTHKILVREALLKFPSDSKDPSIQASWHALCHLEADEEIRRRDFEYASEQNDFLEMIAFTLQTGEELPENIKKAYDNYHKEALIPHSKGIKGLMEKLTRILNL